MALIASPVLAEANVRITGDTAGSPRVTGESEERIDVGHLMRLRGSVPLPTEVVPPPPPPYRER